MKRKIFFILSFFAFGILHAQEAVKKDSIKKDTTKHIHKPVASTGYIAYTMGYGLPIANFASQNGAEKGTNMGINVGIPIANTGHGIAINVNAGSNAAGLSRFPSTVASQLNNSNEGYTAENTPGSYHYKSLLVGLYVTKPLAFTQNKLSIDYKIMAGFIFATIPQFTIVGLDTAQTSTTINDYAGWGSGFAFGSELGVRYRVLPRLSVMLVADYFTASAAYQLVATGQSTDASGNTTSLPEQVGPAHQNFTLINLSLGVGWTF